MKKLVLILTVIICSSAMVKAEKVNWYSWNDGYKLAKEQNMPMIVFLHATWCHQCNRMDTKVLSTEDIAVFIQDNFIPIKLDVEDEGTFIKDGKEYKVTELVGELTNNKFRGIPSTLFIPEKSGKKNSLIVGLKNPGEMKKLLKKHKK